MDRLELNQDEDSELNILIASEKTEISLYLSDAEMSFLQLTLHILKTLNPVLWNLEKDELLCRCLQWNFFS